MEQVKKNPVEMKELWKKYKRTHKKQYRNTLIKHYMPLVRSVAEKLRMRLPNCVDIEDLTSAGVFGLTDAIKLFDLKRGIKFETYCLNRIRGSMLDELRSLDWVPRLVRTKEHQLGKVCYNMEKRFGRPPTPYEIINELKVSLGDYNKLEKEASVTNILLCNYKKPATSEGDKNNGLFDLIEDENASEKFNQMVLHDVVEYIKHSLSEKEKQVLELYFYDELTMKEIGDVLDISESRVSQIFNSVIIQLRRRFCRRQIEWLA
ncbi:MAG: FliA/WhiG family RNA polymerase sigma factor [Planctomycetota bacterium]